MGEGAFGENLTTSGVDVNGALVGERWHTGPDVLLEVCAARVPCRTFAGELGERGRVKRFTARPAPGAYLRVTEPGEVRAGDGVPRERRPDHDVTVDVLFHALTTAPELLPRVLAARDTLAPKRASTRSHVCLEVSRGRPGKRMFRLYGAVVASDGTSRELP